MVLMPIGLGEILSGITCRNYLYKYRVYTIVSAFVMNINVV